MVMKLLPLRRGKRGSKGNTKPTAKLPPGRSDVPTSTSQTQPETESPTNAAQAAQTSRSKISHTDKYQVRPNQAEERGDTPGHDSTASSIFGSLVTKANDVEVCGEIEPLDFPEDTTDVNLTVDQVTATTSPSTNQVVQRQGRQQVAKADELSLREVMMREIESHRAGRTQEESVAGAESSGAKGDESILLNAPMSESVETRRSTKNTKNTKKSSDVAARQMGAVLGFGVSRMGLPSRKNQRRIIQKETEEEVEEELPLDSFEELSEDSSTVGSTALYEDESHPASHSVEDGSYCTCGDTQINYEYNDEITNLSSEDITDDERADAETTDEEMSDDYDDVTMDTEQSDTQGSTEQSSVSSSLEGEGNYDRSLLSQSDISSVVNSRGSSEDGRIISAVDTTYEEEVGVEISEVENAMTLPTENGDFQPDTKLPDFQSDTKLPDFQSDTKLIRRAQASPVNLPMPNLKKLATWRKLSIKNKQNTKTSRSTPATVSTASQNSATIATHDFADERHRDIHYASHGSVDNLVIRQYVDVPTPKAPDHIVVKITESTVSSRDCYTRTKGNRATGGVPGYHIVGQVHSLGTDINGNAVLLGDRVAALLPDGGGNAKYASIPMKRVIKLPNNIQHEDIICLVANYMAAYQCLKLAKKDGAPLTNENVLITSGMDPVGQALVELALCEGAKVYTTAHRMHEEHLTKLGCKWFAMKPNKWLPFLEGKMDVVVDNLGMDGYESSYQALTPQGKLVCNTSEQFEAVSWWSGVKAKRRGAIFYDVNESYEKDPKMFAHELHYLICKLNRGEISPKVAGKVSLNQVPKAQKLIEKGLPNGCVICLPWMKLCPKQSVEVKEMNS